MIKKFERAVFSLGLICWIISWIILAFTLDIWIYIGFIFYGVGISGLTLYFASKALRLSVKGDK